MPCIQAALSGLSIQMGDIDVFAAVSGPGSFTGLRIGIATIKAFAYACGKPAVGIPTLDSLARNLAGRPGALICPIMDAKNANIYQAIYKSQPIYVRENIETCTRLADTMLIDIGSAAGRLGSALENDPDIGYIIFNGDATLAYIDFFRTELKGVPCFAAAEPELCQNASSAALLACEAADAGRLVSPDALAPDYFNAGYMAKKT